MDSYYLEYLGYFFSILIGISLGLVGSGGSILCIPILVYLFKIPPESATSYSLFIVGVSSFFGTFKNFKTGNIKLKTALLFAIPSVISLLLVRKILLPKMPEILFYTPYFEFTKNRLIMFILAILMLLSSYSMIKTKEIICLKEKSNYVLIITIGILIGLLTGFLGAGGGFLIVPALLYFACLNMKEAVGTSLFVILINSAIGFTGDFANGVNLNYTILFLISIIASFGMFLGFYLSKKINGEKLKPAFGWFLFVFSFYIILKEFLI